MGDREVWRERVRNIRTDRVIYIYIYINMYISLLIWMCVLEVIHKTSLYIKPSFYMENTYVYIYIYMCVCVCVCVRIR